METLICPIYHEKSKFSFLLPQSPHQISSQNFLFHHESDQQQNSIEHIILLINTITVFNLTVFLSVGNLNMRAFVLVALLGVAYGNLCHGVPGEKVQSVMSTARAGATFFMGDLCPSFDFDSVVLTGHCRQLFKQGTYFEFYSNYCI